MNKEEFKQSIISQFSHRDSNIRDLLLAYRGGLRLGDTKYSVGRHLSCSEFGLDIDISTIKGADGEPVFQIIFTDVEDSFSGMNCSNPLWDLSNRHTEEVVYCEEKIEFHGVEIDFYVSQHQLYSGDYLFVRDYHTNGMKVSFNLNTRKFSGDNVVDFRIACEEKQCEKDRIYCSYLFEMDDVKELDKVIGNSCLDEESKLDVAEIFGLVDDDALASPMIQIINGLIEFGEKR